jgi:chromosomal replication initiation ATPase DnaA
MIDLLTTEDGKPFMRLAVMGPSMCGKSTLVQTISHEYFLRERRQTIALVPHDKSVASWGSHSRIFRDKDQFLDFVKETHDCLIVVEDASTTIKQDRDCDFLFTTIRHRGHKLIVVGHRATNLTPQMRDGVERLFLFAQNKESIEIWQSIFPQIDFSHTLTLQRYEFFTCANFQPSLVSKLKR